MPCFTSASKLRISFQYSEPYSTIRIFLRQLLGLRQRQDLQHFVQRSEAARKHHQRLGEIREPELAHEEVVKLEAQLRADVRIGQLLERQPDIQPDGFAAASRAPRLAASMMPGPPPEQTTNRCVWLANWLDHSVTRRASVRASR